MILCNSVSFVKSAKNPQKVLMLKAKSRCFDAEQRRSVRKV
jgi:hypothetical protein